MVRAARLFFGLDLHRQMLLLEASSALAAARLRLGLFPFWRVAKTLGSFSAARPSTAHRSQLAFEELETVREVRWAVRVSSRRVPFRALCLQQAMAAHAMLRRRGIAAVLHLGVASGENEPLWAHAWLDAGVTPITGYPVAPDVTEVGCFI